MIRERINKEGNYYGRVAKTREAVKYLPAKNN